MTARGQAEAGRWLQSGLGYAEGPGRKFMSKMESSSAKRRCWYMTVAGVAQCFRTKHTERRIAQAFTTQGKRISGTFVRNSIIDSRTQTGLDGDLKERVSGLLPAEACCLPQRSLFQLPHPSRSSDQWIYR